MGNYFISPEDRGAQSGCPYRSASLVFVEQSRPTFQRCSDCKWRRRGISQDLATCVDPYHLYHSRITEGWSFTEVRRKFDEKPGMCSGWQPRRTLLERIKLLFRRLRRR